MKKNKKQEVMEKERPKEDQNETTDLVEDINSYTLIEKLSVYLNYL